MIKFNVRNLDSISKKLSSIPRGARGAAVEAAAFVLIGNQSKGLQHYAFRKTHGANNPYEWQSERQRKAYFASDGFGGGIPSRRTDALRFGWKAQAWGDKTKIKIINDAPHAVYVQGDKMQRGHITDGWKHYKTVIASVQTAMRRAIDQSVARYLKSRGL